MRLRVGVVGAGRWGVNLVRTLQRLPEFDLRVVCDLSPSQLGVPWTPNVDELLDDPQLQAVLLATPPETHATLTQRALYAGKQVFVEKPLCLSNAEAQLITDAARRSGGRVMVGHLLCYHPVSRAIARVLSSPTWRGPRQAEVQRWSEPGLHPERCPWWSLAPHDLALFHVWFGAALRVRATHSMPGHVQAELHYASAHVSLSLSTRAAHKLRRLSVSTQGESLLFDDLSEHKLVRTELGKARGVAVASEAPLDAELQHFAQQLRSGGAFTTDLEQGVRVVQVLEAGQRSLDRAGRWVTLASAEPALQQLSEWG